MVEIVYDPPPEHARNGQITKYEIQFWKESDPNQKKVRQTTEEKTVFANLEDNTKYLFSARANTRKGYGPWSTQTAFRTDKAMVRAPLNVKAMATSDSSVQVRGETRVWKLCLERTREGGSISQLPFDILHSGPH